MYQLRHSGHRSTALPLQPALRLPPGAQDLHLACTGAHAKTQAYLSSPRCVNQLHQALASGVQTTSVVLLPYVVPTCLPVTSLLYILPTRIVYPSYSFSYASLPAPCRKPVASALLNQLAPYPLWLYRTASRFAHFTEQIYHYLLSYNTNLQRSSSTKCSTVCVSASSRKSSTLLNREHFTCILNTSVIMVQAFRYLHPPQASCLAHNAGQRLVQPSRYRHEASLLQTLLLLLVTSVPPTSRTPDQCGHPPPVGCAGGIGCRHCPARQDRGHHRRRQRDRRPRQPHPHRMVRQRRRRLHKKLSAGENRRPFRCLGEPARRDREGRHRRIRRGRARRRRDSLALQVRRARPPRPARVRSTAGKGKRRPQPGVHGGITGARRDRVTLSGQSHG